MGNFHIWRIFSSDRQISKFKKINFSPLYFFKIVPGFPLGQFYSLEHFKKI